MPSDHHDSPPEQFEADDSDETSSIGDSSLLAPPTSHRHPYNYSGPHAGPHELQSFLNDLATSLDPPVPLATTMNQGSAMASSGPMRAATLSEYSDVFTLPNPHLRSPHQSRFHDGRVSPPNVPPPQQSLVSPDGYAPVESLPPQNYIPSARTGRSISAPIFPPRSRRTSLFVQSQGAAPPILGAPDPITFVPPNSELARPRRFTFAPPGVDVPADPITSPTSASPASPHSRREKAKAKLDKTSQQPTQNRSDGRARSYSWSVVPYVFRRKSGVSMVRFDGPVACADNGRAVSRTTTRPITAHSRRATAAHCEQLA